MTYRLRAPVVREHPLQKQIADVLRRELGPPAKVSRFGVTWFCIDHANYAGEVPGVRIGRGIVSGIPDLFVLHRGRSHVIEIKADDGSLSEPQQSVLAAMLHTGTAAAVCRDWIEVLACLDTWEIPRNRRVIVPLEQAA
jgi:hypothetical protein